MEIWQGGMKKVTELGVEEVNTDVKSSQVLVMPNPCVGETRFVFELPAGLEYTIAIYDVSGRRIREFKGVSLGEHSAVQWNVRDSKGQVMSSGIYFYEFTSLLANTSGKIIVR